MKPPVCYLNGRYVELSKAAVPATDRGFLFGEGLFETWPVYAGRPFAVREHVTRMAKSARALGIPFDPGEDWAGRSVRLAKLNGVTGAGAIRFTITRGSGPVTLIPGRAAKPTRLMLFRPLEDGLDLARANGVSVHLVGFGRGVNPAMRQLKTLNYLPAVRGKMAAADRGAFESLYRLDDSTVLEGTTSNFFVVSKGKIYTTPVGDGILPGVTRSIVMKIARRLTEVGERRITTDDLANADEMFITSSTIEVVPVLRVDRMKIGNGRVGELTRDLQQRYRRYAARRLGLGAGDLG